MTSASVRSRVAVVGAVLVVTSLVGLTPAAAEASSSGTGPLAGAPLGEPASVVDGTKGTGVPPSTPPGPAANAIGDVAISSEGCTVDPVPFGGQTVCRYDVQNQTTTPTTVTLRASGDPELAVVGADHGAVVSGGEARADGVPLPPRGSSPIQVEPGPVFAGYVPLESIGIGPQPIEDDQIRNFPVQPFRWNGQTYTSLGISANGYVVVGGADEVKDATATPQDVPDPGRPNNVLAPFWTDLTPAGGGTLRAAGVSNTALPPCERSYFIAIQWDMVEFGTSTERRAQLWIQADDPQCDTDDAPAERIEFTYDLATMTAPPARPFRVAAEDATGTVGGTRPAGELPTTHYRVTSSGTPQPAPTVRWNVVAEGRAGGTGTIAAQVESSLIPGSTTVFTNVHVLPEPAPVVTDDPDDVTVTAGQQAVFSAAATGAASVRWQVQRPGEGGWSDVPGATATTLAFTATSADDGNRYRAVFVNGAGGETATAAAELHVAAVATVTTVVPSPAAPAVGQAVTFTATVTPAPTGGTVEFTVDGAPLGGPVPVTGGTATSIATTTLAAGDHAVTATYSGAGDHGGSTGTGGVSVAKVATTTALSVSPAVPRVGDEVAFTATVAPADATGTVTFTLDGEPVGGPVPVVGGTAEVPGVTGLERGSHVVVARFSGSDVHAMSTSGPTTFAVARRATTTSVAVDPVETGVGSPVTFTASVAPEPDGGTVQFAVDGTPVGAPVAVVDGTATSPPTTSLAVGEHEVTAAYTGDDRFGPSTSDAATVTVRTPEEAFVRLAFPAVLGRAGDPGGIAYFAGLLEAGTAPEVVTQRMAGSAEGRGRMVDLAYRRTLGRPADPDGLRYWADRVAAGLTAEDLLARLVATAEASAAHGGTAEGLARALFAAHLDRAPGSPEVAYWRDRLDAQPTSAGRRHVAVSFGRTPEATTVAVRRATDVACGPGARGSSALVERWAANGRDPLRLAGSALALTCPPPGLAP